MSVAVTVTCAVPCHTGATVTRLPDSTTAATDGAELRHERRAVLLDTLRDRLGTGDRQQHDNQRRHANDRDGRRAPKGGGGHFPSHDRERGDPPTALQPVIVSTP